MDSEPGIRLELTRPATKQHRPTRVVLFLYRQFLTNKGSEATVGKPEG